MKVGIVTLPLHVNYGGIIQAYALKTVLERQGHDVWTINRDYWPRLPLWKKPLTAAHGFFSVCKLKRTISFRVLRELDDMARTTRRNTQRFIDAHIGAHISVANLTDLSQHGLDAIIVGSDQIWRPEYVSRLLHVPVEDAFLSFATNWDIRRVSYAASFGVDSWAFSARQTKNCADLAKSFDAVSVREDDGILLCREYLGIEAERVLDPTMLLDRTDYEQLIAENSHEAKDRDVLFSYVLDATDDKTKIIHKLSSLFNLDISTIDLVKAGAGPASLQNTVAPSVESWLTAFRDAKLVVTDSFHACVFSILFQKPFFAYVNPERGAARFHSLLELFGLGNRLVHASEELTDARLAEGINWLRVGEKIEAEKANSLRFLEKALSE